MAAMRASRSTPSGVSAWLKQAMVGTSPWLNAPNVGLRLLMAATSSRAFGHRGGRGAGLSSGSCRGASGAELVRGVEGRDLVALGQGRIVEDGPEKVIQPGPETQDRLPDLHQLGGPGADAMLPEEAMVVSVEQQLEHAGVVTQDLATRDLAVPGHAGLVGHL